MFESSSSRTPDTVVSDVVSMSLLRTIGIKFAMDWSGSKEMDSMKALKQNSGRFYFEAIRFKVMEVIQE